MSFKKGQIDTTTLMLISAGALAIAGVFVFLWMTGFFSPNKTVYIAGVPIVDVPKDAPVQIVGRADEARIKEIYSKYKRIIVEIGESSLNYEAARTDAIGKLAERLQTLVERFTEYAKAELAEAMAELQSEKKKEAVDKISTEVYRMAQKTYSKTFVVGAHEIVRYQYGGKYYSVVYLDPEAVYQAITAQADVIKDLAEKYGAQAEAIFEATRKALDKAYEGTPLENK